MGHQSSYTQWLTSDEVSAEDKARLASLSEEEKKEAKKVKNQKVSLKDIVGVTEAIGLCSICYQDATLQPLVVFFLFRKIVSLWSLMQEQLMKMQV